MSQRWMSLCVLALAGAVPSVASAQQALTEFVTSARSRALDAREARASVDQARSQVDEARARLLPSALGQLSYQRNDPVVVVNIPTGMVDGMGNPITAQASITPLDQVSATAQLTVPILDLTAWTGFFQAEAAADGSEAQLASTQQTVDLSVVQLWHSLVAQHALVHAAERNLATTRESLENVRARVEAGVAAGLELARAQAEFARAEQTLAEAELAVRLGERNLQNLTGLAPSNANATLDDDLHEEAALDRFVARVDDLPGQRAARTSLRAARIARDGAWFGLLPTLSGVAVARWTNAAGFGRQDTYYLGASATWNLDFARPARIGTAEASARAAEVRAERVTQQLETAVFEAWHRVSTSRASVASARALLEASQRAASDARARVESGSGTQLDQIQAERDLFQAEVSVIQAVANLRVARASLRIRSGLEIDAAQP